MNDFVQHFIKLYGGTLSSEVQNLMRLLSNIIAPYGVKIGGKYRHFKGDLYIVKDISLDSENMGNSIVTYVKLADATQQWTRSLKEFLGEVDKPEYKGRRFTFMG